MPTDHTSGDTRSIYLAHTTHRQARRAPRSRTVLEVLLKLCKLGLKRLDDRVGCDGCGDGCGGGRRARLERRFGGGAYRYTAHGRLASWYGIDVTQVRIHMRARRKTGPENERARRGRLS